jgi:hypothetical protein
MAGLALLATRLRYALPGADPVVLVVRSLRGLRVPRVDATAREQPFIGVRTRKDSWPIPNLRGEFQAVFES